MSYSIIKSKGGAVIILDNSFYDWTDYVDCDTLSVEVLENAKLNVPTQQELEDRYDERYEWDELPEVTESVNRELDKLKKKMRGE